MIRKRLIIGRLLIVFFLFGIFSTTAAAAEQAPRSESSLPVKGMVTMVDIGAKACIPCKMMAPIMEQLEKEYQGKAAIVFIDVWKNPKEGPRFGIRAIPTQIFYDRDGKEALRHVGFMDKKSIVSQLEKMGVK